MALVHINGSCNANISSNNGKLTCLLFVGVIFKRNNVINQNCLKSLELNFTNEEVSSAIMHLGLRKNPGPMGITSESINLNISFFGTDLDRHFQLLR